MKKKASITFLQFSGTAILNSYAMLFFSRNRIFAALILLVSFFNPFTGLSGFLAVMVALLSAYILGFNREQIKNGFYTYAALLVGLGLGTYYEQGTAFFILLTAASIFTLLLTVALTSKLGSNNLPALSLSFIFSTWIIILASKEFSAIGLTQRHIYWVNDMYAKGGKRLVDFIMSIENYPMPDYVAGFFRSMSAILFQVNIFTGIILTAGIFVFSRIAFVLMILGYTVAFLFQHTMGSGEVVNYYNLGTNYMLVAVAVGGLYLIPSVRSFLWAAILVPVSYLLVIGLSKITLTWGLPVFSLPFCIVVILFLYCLRLRNLPGKLAVTPVQYFSPEINLYRYRNGKERLMNRYYYQLQLPFMGEWMVSQGYDGDMTHKAEWSKALDFVILDEQMKTFSLPGNQPEHFYCFNKPVLSPGDGIIEEIVDHVTDNEIGKNNTSENWGNTIIIKHAEGLYSKLSHLKKNSAKVIKGSYVRKGDILALCGNSGRSPEPHLHFQVQTTPYIGSKTISYPISYFKSRKENKSLLNNFTVPAEGSFTSNVLPDTQLVQAFNLQPGFCMLVNANGFEEEEWEVVTSIYNESYLYCRQHNAYAYFINNGTVFYFSNYFGSKRSLLYHFYLAAYKIVLSTDLNVTITDNYPLNVLGFHPLRWIQDLIAPFHIFIKIKYESNNKSTATMLGSGEVTLESKRINQWLWSKKEKSSASITIKNGEIQSFNFKSDSKNIQASCKKEN
ncbi:MAG: urea transporter [Ferruginibacter sp.]